MSRDGRRTCNAGAIAGVPGARRSTATPALIRTEPWSPPPSAAPFAQCPQGNATHHAFHRASRSMCRNAVRCECVRRARRCANRHRDCRERRSIDVSNVVANDPRHASTTTASTHAADARGLPNRTSTAPEGAETKNIFSGVHPPLGCSARAVRRIASQPIARAVESLACIA